MYEIGDKFTRKDKIYEVKRIIEGQNATWYELSFEYKGDMVTSIIGSKVLDKEYKRYTEDRAV